jgi:serine/threonine protein phosphatase PrpC
MRAALWGNEHTELDVIATAAVDASLGIAITRGRHPKAYRYVDDNEDVVAIVSGPRSRALVCADGHNGAMASHVAVQEVLDALGDDPPPALDDNGWLDLFERVSAAVMAQKGVGAPQPASNTVLQVALVAAGEVSWAAIGDAALVLAQPGGLRGRQLNKEAMRFVGYPMNRRSLKSTVQRGRTPLEPGEWVVSVTDGLSEFVAPMRPADVVPRVLGAADRDRGDAEAAARMIVDAAGQAGAGDNVACAVCIP